MKRNKIKTHALLSTTVNYETVQYFYKLEEWRYGDNPKFRVFILDPDNLVYEFLLKCPQSELEENIISFCEGEH